MDQPRSDGDRSSISARVCAEAELHGDGFGRSRDLAGRDQPLLDEEILEAVVQSAQFLELTPQWSLIDGNRPPPAPLAAPAARARGGGVELGEKGSRLDADDLEDGEQL